MRQISSLDSWIGHLDQALRVTLGPAPAPDTRRRSPAEDHPEAELSPEQRRLAAGLMRINHTGEVCAQALYAGQAATARSDGIRTEMEQAAAEEVDHLSWCAGRLQALDSRPSLLNPVWYAGSFAIGAGAGLAGDPWSLGFVEATERQVEAHLDRHLERLPEADLRSRAVVARMKDDEARHAQMARQSGARILPRPVQWLMAGAANVMKAIAYRI